MKFLYPALFPFLFAGITCFAQTAAPTPMPPIQNANIDADAISKKAALARPRISESLYEYKSLAQYINIVAYEPKPEDADFPKIRLEILLRERIWGEIGNEDDRRPVKLLIDGELFPITKRTFDKTINYAAVIEEPIVYTQIFTFEVPPEKLVWLSEAKSMSIIWHKTSVLLTPEAMDILRKFILNEK